MLLAQQFPSRQKFLVSFVSTTHSFYISVITYQHGLHSTKSISQTDDDMHNMVHSKDQHNQGNNTYITIQQ